jgi:hypothetical protein
MTFTIASAAREALGEVVKGRLRKEKEDDDRRTREYEEVRGCAVHHDVCSHDTRLKRPGHGEHR